jgi:hypothetical protein
MLRFPAKLRPSLVKEDQDEDRYRAEADSTCILTQMTISKDERYEKITRYWARRRRICW